MGRLLGLLRRGELAIALMADRVAGDRRRASSLRAAHRYWSAPGDDDAWQSNSHWRTGLADDLWQDVGRQHLDMYRVFAAGLGRTGGPGVTIEWGCGGGANAASFAPLASRFIAADISADSVAECLTQVRAVCDTPVQGIHIDIADAVAASDGLEGSCDTFLCYYVIELTAAPKDALDILAIAERVLTSGGIAVVQVKYHTAQLGTRGRGGRGYRRHLAQTTTFAIDEFWEHAAASGLIPRLVTLVPRNELDSRYAYYALTKP
ncbi:methyltransferase domain-containing protein [Mycobacterium sp. NPDC050551]|uniref:class I SAM-dependent methyltransferase n=1 Tax=Mycobacterium sp. NPDC050551 TaxID=3155407 RepID=UPI00341BF0B4